MQTVARFIDQFVPENYKLLISLDRAGRTFSGGVTIFGEVRTNSNSINLHSKGLNIDFVLVDEKPATFSFEKDDALIITRSDLYHGNHKIFIKFNGDITDSMHGLYPCYFKHNGADKELLATQFESHHAREVFPCIDEPAAKATFDVTITTEKNVEVIGNMPIKTQIENDNNLITTFDTTPIMSVYLLAWVVGELHKKTATTKGGVEVNVWATPAQSSESLDFALDIAVRSIDFFDEYFGIAYPLPKSDHVALPDFSSGAMENWGLVTYREIALLADPKTTSISSKHYIATVITHELSHQWFGNLVTMEWWNDLWLNESFASLIEYVAVDALEPSWDVWQDFASTESIISLKRDSLAGVQSVQNEVNHPDEIDTLFDGAIVYAKGARLIQALRYYIGEDNFRSGLKHYFEKHAYKNTTAHDLWAAFKEASGKDIELFMSKWISQPGFPVIHASLNGDQLTLSQERLTNADSDKSDKLWPITLNSNTPILPNLFSVKEATFVVSSDSCIRLNVGNNVHFITHYSDNLLERIINELEAGKLSPIDRLQLLNEQRILADAGIIRSTELLKLLQSYKNEDTESVWCIIGSIIGEQKKFVENDDLAEEKLRQFVGSLAKEQYDRLGWDAKQGEDESNTKLRGLILGMMLYSENAEVIEKAIEIFHSAPIEQIDPEISHIVFTAAVRYEHLTNDIDNLINTYSKTDSCELQMAICSGLTSTRDEQLIIRLLNSVKDSNVVRAQDSLRWLVHLMRNKHGRQLTWRWIRDNWDWIEEKFKGDKSYDEYPRYSALSLSTESELAEYRYFFEPMKIDPALSRIVEMGINEIQNRIDLIARDGEAVRKVLLNL